jgi:hypothetical protein
VVLVRTDVSMEYIAYIIRTKRFGEGRDVSMNYQLKDAAKKYFAACFRC